MGARDQAATLGYGQRDMHGSAMGGSPEVSLVFAPVAHPPQGLHLCDLKRTGVLTKVPVIIGEVRRMLAVRKQTQRGSARSQGLGGLLRLRYSFRRRWWLGCELSKVGKRSGWPTKLVL
jgi:hypothetical protein